MHESPHHDEGRAEAARRTGSPEVGQAPEGDRRHRRSAHGDLKENAEYHAAREEQGFIEGRIKQLEGELSHAEIIDVSKLNAGSKVVFGASVTLADVETDEEKKYQIVGDLEADIKLGLIAISSPVARAMIGKLEGDSIVIDAPAGQREYEIVSVSYVD
jgi:transcription elongation factor GreA